MQALSLIYWSQPKHNYQPTVDNRTLSTSAVSTASDVVLLARIAKREQAAVGELYDKHSSLLYTLVLRIVRDRAEAEDALQEVFMRIWDKADQYNETLGAPMVWMTRIARNLSIDKLRSKLGQARKAEDDLDVHDELSSDERSSNPEFAAALSQQQSFVANAMSSLPKEQRILIEFAYFQGYTQSELAEHFRLPLGTVKTRMRTGMLALRRQLEHVA
jgi:RNA polymerase sigma-70 factor (ECF subfamily)